MNSDRNSSDALRNRRAIQQLNREIETGALSIDSLKVTEGADAVMGVATLVAGSAVVSTNRVTANSRIMLTHQGGGVAIGFPHVGARVPGSSFAIVSSNGSDTGVVAFLIVEPA